MSDLQHIDDVFAGLGQVDSLPPNSNFDAENLWKNLHEELKPRAKKPFAGWYWAVALLALILGFFVWIPQHSKPVIGQVDVLKPATKLSQIKQQKTDKLSDNQVVNASKNLKKTNRSPLDQETQPLISNQETLPLAARPLVFSQETQPLTLNQEAPPLTQIVFNQEKKTKPKLKIVHANQLEDTGEKPNLEKPKNNIDNTFWVIGSPMKITSGQDHASSIPLITTQGIKHKE